MSLLFIEGFENGHANGSVQQRWTTFGSYADTAIARTGSYGLRQNGGSTISKRLAVADQHATVIVGFANYGPAASHRMCWIGSDDGATAHVSVYRTSDGRIRLHLGDGGTQLAETAAGLILANTWNYFEFKLVLADAGGSAIVRRNGSATPILNFSGDTKNGGTKTVLDTFLLGGGNDLTTGYDDVYICNGAGSLHNDFLGDCTVQTYYPNGNGNSSQLLGSDGNSTDNYLLTDENPANTTDYVGSATAGQLDTYAFADIASGTILGVQTQVYAAKSDAGLISARQVSRVNGVNYTDSDLSLSTTYLPFVRMMEVSPDTGVAWTLSEYNSSEFGFEVRAG